MYVSTKNSCTGRQFNSNQWNTTKNVYNFGYSYIIKSQTHFIFI